MSVTEERVSTPPMEDYAKAIYSLTRGQTETASTSALAERLGITAGSVSAMLKRLDSVGLVEHVPYHGVKLTEAGRQVALRVLRRHRLLELFLRDTLDLPWEDLDHHADRLEHAVDDELIEIIAAKLGDPKSDPHGDPIPTRELQIDDQITQRLDDLPPGVAAVIVRVSDADPEKLRYLTQQGIAIGSPVQVTGRQPFDGPLEVQIAHRDHVLGLSLARAVYTQPPPSDGQSTPAANAGGARHAAPRA